MAYEIFGNVNENNVEKDFFIKFWRSIITIVKTLFGTYIK
jgi:hypothetical protein